MNFYMEIAKLRAARLLWAKLMKVHTTSEERYERDRRATLFIIVFTSFIPFSSIIACCHLINTVAPLFNIHFIPLSLSMIILLLRSAHSYSFHYCRPHHIILYYSMSYDAISYRIILSHHVMSYRIRSYQGMT